MLLTGLISQSAIQCLRTRSARAASASRRSIFSLASRREARPAPSSTSSVESSRDRPREVGTSLLREWVQTSSPRSPAPCGGVPFEAASLHRGYRVPPRRRAPTLPRSRPDRRLRQSPRSRFAVQPRPEAVLRRARGLRVFLRALAPARSSTASSSDVVKGSLPFGILALTFPSVT